MLDVNYIAGFLDGEGCFTIIKTARQRAHPVIEVANTDILVMQLLYHTLESWGIHCYLYKRLGRRENQQDSWELRINNMDDIHTICVILKDKLVTKQQQAAILAEFTGLRMIEGRQGNVFTERQKELRRNIQELNKRGNL